MAESAGTNLTPTDIALLIDMLNLGTVVANAISSLMPYAPDALEFIASMTGDVAEPIVDAVHDAICG